MADDWPSIRSRPEVFPRRLLALPHSGSDLSRRAIHFPDTSNVPLMVRRTRAAIAPTVNLSTWMPAQRSVIGGCSRGLFAQDALKEQVVLPGTGNLEVFFGNADGLESRFAQDLLGTEVM